MTVRFNSKFPFPRPDHFLPVAAFRALVEENVKSNVLKIANSTVVREVSFGSFRLPYLFFLILPLIFCLRSYSLPQQQLQRPHFPRRRPQHLQSPLPRKTPLLSPRSTSTAGSTMSRMAKCPI
jgi:hypothetical protein